MRQPKVPGGRPAMDYFFYGTLMDEDVLERVAGRRFGPRETEPAWVEGFDCYYVAGAWYPMLVEAPGGRVAGRLVHGIDALEESRIRYFEGDDYETRTLTVATRRGTVAALTFMPKTTLSASPEPWQLARWRRRHKRIYLMRLSEWLPPADSGR